MSWEVRAEVVQVLVAPATWKANLVAVLVADWVLVKVRGIPGLPEAKFAVIVVVAKETDDDAWRLPAIWRGAATVEEALEINPPTWVAKPATDKVDEA